jgi:hypothetical protein
VLAKSKKRVNITAEDEEGVFIFAGRMKTAAASSRILKRGFGLVIHPARIF